MSTIVVADDDVTVRGVVRRYLERDGHTVIECDDGRAALDAIGPGVDLAVLDVMMPKLDGVEVCRRIRSGACADLPVVLLTALGSAEDRINGLEIGADDYVTKPFSPRELALRVAGLLRRVAATEPTVPHDPIVDGSVELNPASRAATVAGQPVTLTNREFDLLAFFIGHPGEAYDRDQLLTQVWGWDFGDHSTVTVHVRRLRAKLGPAADRLQTVWGHGYLWAPNPSSAPTDAGNAASSGTSRGA